MIKAQFEYDRDYIPSAPVIQFEMEGYVSGVAPVQVSALVDSGADGTMIPIDLLQKVGAIYVDSVQMVGVVGNSQIVDRYRIRVRIGDILINGIDAVAIGENESALVERDVLNQLIVTLDGLAGVVRISD